MNEINKNEGQNKEENAIIQYKEKEFPKVFECMCLRNNAEWLVYQIADGTHGLDLVCECFKTLFLAIDAVNGKCKLEDLKSNAMAYYLYKNMQNNLDLYVYEIRLNLMRSVSIGSIVDFINDDEYVEVITGILKRFLNIDDFENALKVNISILAACLLACRDEERCLYIIDTFMNIYSTSVLPKNFDMGFVDTNIDANAVKNENEFEYAKSENGEVAYIPISIIAAIKGDKVIKAYRTFQAEWFNKNAKVEKSLLKNF